MLVLLFPLAQRLLRDVPGGVGFLCDKGAVLGEGIKGTSHFAEADCISGHENVRFMWYPMFRCYICNIPPPVAVLSQLNLYRILSF
jgi:hypothetical protein